MSYHILYDKQFIKVDAEHVIPFYLGGDNNMYESNSPSKRARDWHNGYAHTDKSMVVCNKQLLDSIDVYRKQTIERCNDNVKEYKDESWAYDDKRWGYHVSVALYGKHTTKTTFAAYRNFYKTGIEQAMTIEELAENGVRINMVVSPWADDKELKAKGLERKPSVTFTSTQQMVEAIAEYEAYYGGAATLYLYEVGMQWFLDKKRRTKRNERIINRSQKQIITVNEYFVLRADVNGFRYFVKQVRNGGYMYCFSTEMCKSFRSEKDAKRFHKHLRCVNEFEVVKIEGSKKFRV